MHGMCKEKLRWYCVLIFDYISHDNCITIRANDFDYDSKNRLIDEVGLMIDVECWMIPDFVVCYDEFSNIKRCFVDTLRKFSLLQ